MLLPRRESLMPKADTGHLGRTVAVVIVIVLAISGCSIGDEARPSIETQDRDCHLGPTAVPSCGVLWGISTQPRSLQHLESLERSLGRPFDLVYHYIDINGNFPDVGQRREAAGGRLLHVAIAARDFHGRPGSIVSWADVAAGKYDKSLAAQARGVASLNKPVFVTFAQEASAPTKLGVNGSATDFKSAWRHLYKLYQKAGATNAVWTWVMTGASENLEGAAALWPGSDVVDWISWNVYNGSGCQAGLVDPTEFVSFEDQMRVFYDFVQRSGKSVGIDRTKPMMISEAGSVSYPSDSSLAADWYAAIPSALRKYPQVKAVTLWDSTTDDCDYRFHTSPESVERVRQAGLDPAVDSRPAASRNSP